MQQEIITNTITNFNYLNSMPCNTVVNLQVLTPTKAVRIKTRLIGIDPNMSVILAIRHDGDWFSAKNYIREGQGAIVRLISPNCSEANIIAFRTNIQKVMSIAGNWLVLDYPKELEKVSLRKYSRIPINIECAIIDGETKEQLSSGFLNDISVNGCAFSAKQLTEINKESKGCEVGSKYTLQVKMESEENTLLIPVIVKNQLEKDQQYGLAFEENNQTTIDFIQKIIIRHLSTSPSVAQASASE